MDDDTDEKDDSKRKSRNLSEKKRRDQFNLLVNELSSMVSSNNRKMDKSTVLKSTIAFLKNHNEITVRSRAHEIQEDWKPAFLSNEEFTHLILEALDGFIIVFSSKGNIIYASESITSLLGHLPGDLQNMTIYDLSYEDDHTHLYNLLLSPSNIADPLQDGILRENQIVFSCHLKRGGLEYREKVAYELVQFTGYFRSDVDLENMLPNPRCSSSYSEAENRLIFVGTGRLQIPQLIREMSIIDSLKSEFTSRHSLEWKFLFLDHRAPPIIGYLPFEVLGTSGYDYYHFDDLEKVVACHEALLQKGEGTSCYYRFLTKGQQWIWLQTRFYITYHQWNSKPEFVVCTHRVVNYVDVMKNTGNATIDQSNCVQNENSRELVDTQTFEKHLQNSSMSTTFWSAKSSSKVSRIGGTRSPSTKAVRRQTSYYSGCGTGSDSTSHSTESITSRQSHSTQYSVRSRIRHSSKHSSQSVITQNQQQSLHPAMHNAPLNTHMQQSELALSQQLVHQQAHQSNFTAPSFLEPPQYLAAIPIQPVIAPAFPAGAAVISSLQPPPEIIHAGVVMTPAQNQIQDQLQRKHEELQHLIVQQQEELRRVSEQLLMARYGLLPTIVNVSLPFTTSIGSSSTRSISTTAHQHHEPHQLVNLDHHICGVTQSQGIPPTEAQSQQNLQGPVPSNEMISYIQLSSGNTDSDSGVNQQPPQSTHHLHNSLSQPILNNDIELMPYQMSQEQAQLLFSSNVDSPSSTKQERQ